MWVKGTEGVFHNYSFVDKDGVHIEIPGSETMVDITLQTPWLYELYDFIPSEIRNELTVDQNFTINKQVHVKSGATLRFENNCTIELINDAQIIVEEGAILEVEGGSEIKGTIGQDNNIIVYGNINLEAGAKITNLSNGTIGGLYIDNQQDIVFDNLTFENSFVHIDANLRNVSVKNSVFNGSSIGLNLKSGLASEICIVENNTFEGINDVSALEISQFGMFKVKNNVFENNTSHAIHIYNAGLVGSRYRTISGNTITNNHRENKAKGILIYNSAADVFDNTIGNNDYGIGLYHNSNSRVYGIRESIENGVYQQISNNDKYEVYAYDNSFPTTFELNVISDVYDGYRLIYCVDRITQTYDVTQNCWPDDFTPSRDLYPYRSFTGYDRIWDCEISAPGELEIPDPKLQYTAAVTNLEAGDYTIAETQLKSVINTWPETSYAEAAIKSLPAVEIAAGTDFSNTINFLKTNAEIQQLDNLRKLADYTVANCNIYRKNYAEALGFYESIIANPPAYEDYVYAVIDAGRVALKMEEEGKAGYTFKFPELVPEDQVSYEKNRDYLLGTIKPLEGEESTGSETDLESTLGVLGESFDCANGFAIYPNPFTQQTSVSYYVNTTTNVDIKLYNATGALVKVVENGIQTSGEHTVTIDGLELSQGVYYIAMQQEGQKPVVKKLVLLK